MAKDKEEIRPKSKPFIDIKEQAALGAEVPPEHDVTGEVYALICQTADVLREKNLRRGALIVIGRFASIGSVKGAIARPPNPFEGLYVSAGDKAFQRMLLQDDALADGAVVVDTSGQVLGGRIYFFIESYNNVEIPEGSFARHIAAAVTSLRQDVEAVVTLSEERNVARVFRGGKVVEEYDPEPAAGAGAAKEVAAEAAAAGEAPQAKKKRKRKDETGRRTRRKSGSGRRPADDPPAGDASKADAGAAGSEGAAPPGEGPAPKGGGA